MKKTTRSFLQKPSTTGVLIGVLVVAFSVVGLLLVQTPLEQPQDVRRQASIDRGEVTVSHSVQPSELSVGQTNTVMLSVNTAGVPTDGIQVLFNVVTDTFDSMTADIVTDGGLKAAGTQIERTRDGFLVQAFALPATIGQPFVTTGDISPVFLKMSFTPTKTGTIAFNFDREESISILHGSNPLEDKLNHINPFTLTVTEDGDPETSPSPTPSPDAISGIRVVGCNQECSSNAECGVNQRCYNVDGTGRCRLAVNPTNDRCITTDVGPNYSCNHGCADTHECAAGLTCWYNQCRNPLNVESTSCAQLTQTQTENLAASCNASCESNNDCDINLRCYNGACRLVTNPSSSTCSAATAKTISSVYSAPKGGASPEVTEKTDSTKTATSAANVSPSPVATPVPATEVTEEITAGMTLEDTPVSENETALDVLMTMMKSPDSALPLIIIGSGVGLLILALIIIAVRRLTGGSASPTPSRTATTTATPTPKPEAAVTRTDMGTPLTTARSMTTPTASMPTQTTLQRQASAAQGMPPAATQPSASGQSSMLQRMKDKGISAPQTPSEPQK